MPPRLNCECVLRRKRLLRAAGSSRVEPTRRLLYVTPDFYPARGGYSSASTGFAQAVSRDGRVALDVLTGIPLGDHKELALPGVRVLRARPPALLPARAGPVALQWSLRRDVSAAMKRKDYEAIVFETAELPWVALWAVRRYGNKVIVRVHASAETEWVLFRPHWLYRLKRRPTRRLFRRVNSIHATTPYYLDFVRHHFLNDNVILASGKSFHVIPNVIEDRLPEAGIEPSPASGEILFLTLGRQDASGESQKNFSRLLQALSILRGRDYFDRIRLLVVGKGELRPRLEALAGELRIAKSVEFRDGLSDVELATAQRTAAAVILASTYEGLSMFALESLAAGAPLLFADTGGLRDLVEPGKNGLLFDPLLIENIAQAIDTHVTTIVPRIEEARAASRAKFEREFAEGRTIDRFVAALDLLAAKDQAGL